MRHPRSHFHVAAANKTNAVGAAVAAGTQQRSIVRRHLIFYERSSDQADAVRIGHPAAKL